MKKHFIVALALVIVLLLASSIGRSSIARAQTNTTLINSLKAQVTRLQAILLTLTKNPTPKPFEISKPVSLISSLNNQIAAKIGRVSPDELRSILVQRKAAMLNLAKINPRLFLTQKLSPAIIQQIPPELRNDVEQSVSLTGRLEVMHIDDFKNPENSRYDYSLVVGPDKYALYPTRPINSASGAVLAVSGSRLDEIIVVEAEDATQFRVVTPAPPLDSVGEQKTLVLLIDFQDSGPRPFTREEAFDLIFNGQSQKFYQEQSYGKVLFSGNVYDWITLPGSGPSFPCGFGLGTLEVESFLVNNNIGLAEYDRLIFIGPGGGGCSSVGKNVVYVGEQSYNLSVAWVGALLFDHPSFQHPFSWTILDSLLAHELGHSLGVYHANGWDCGNQVLHGDCEHIEYGNYFDVMGAGERSLHFNAFYKQLLGWLDSSSILEIARSGRYTLAPLEVDSGKRLAIIQWVGPDGKQYQPFYLEHRRAIGFDAKLSQPELSSNERGLFINKKLSTWQTFPRLLDASATNFNWYDDTSRVTLNTRNIFVDEDYGVRLQPVLVGKEGGVTFDVTFLPPSCTRRPPGIFIATILGSGVYGNPIFPGVTNFLIGVVVFYSNDSIACSDSRFSISAVSLPDGWSFTTRPIGELVLPPDENEYRSYDLLVSIPTDAQLGVYPITFALSNLDAGLQTTFSGLVKLIPPLIISEINPTSGVPGTEVKIKGSGFPTDTPLTLQFVLPGVHRSNYEVFEVFEVLSSDDTTIHFVIPSIPPGIYDVTIHSREYEIKSNTVTFEVLTPPPVPSLTIFSPNGKELILRGDRLPYRITWQELNFPNPNSHKIKLNLKSDTGADRVLFSNLASGVGYQNWSVPKDLPLGKYKLQVCATKDSTPCAYSDQSDDYFTIIEVSTSEPITPIIPSPVEPTQITAPTTTAAIISPVIVTPSPTPLPTLLSSTPPHNAIDARDGSDVSWKIAALTFSADLGRDWNNLGNYSVSSTQPQIAATAPPSVASISGSPYRPIVVLSRNIVPGERVTLTHKPTNTSVCLGFLPGNVDQDAWSLSRDISLLNSWVGTATGAAQPLYKTDINRDGVFDAKDVTRAGELMSAPNRVYRIPACPAPLSLISSQNQMSNALSALRAALSELSKLMSR